MKITRARVNKTRINLSAVRTQRELGYAAPIDIVVLVKSRISVSNLGHGLDDIVPAEEH
jgi:hypothetical protein